MNHTHILLEVLSEEMPVHSQQVIHSQWVKQFTHYLTTHHLGGQVQVWVTPRRAMVALIGIQSEVSATTVEKKGPSVNADPAIISKFKSANQGAEFRIQKEYWFADYHHPATPIALHLQQHLANLLSVEFKKSMQFSHYQLSSPLMYSSAQSLGVQRWIRPILNLMALIDNGNGQVQPLALEWLGLQATPTTWGHRLTDSLFTLNQLSSQEAIQEAYRKQCVIIDTKERESLIQTQCNNLIQSGELNLSSDHWLKENAGLTEYPFAIRLDLNPEFRTLPYKITQTVIEENQKCFILGTPQDNSYTITAFVFIANKIPTDSGASIRHHLHKVVNARLSDAKFFFDLDFAFIKQQLTSSNEAIFSSMHFYSKQGKQVSLKDKVLALKAIAPHFIYYKLDLVTQLVNEFPELQGYIGSVILGQLGVKGYEPIAHQYQLLSEVTLSPTQTTDLALFQMADYGFNLSVLFDTMGERATGSGDPFALRRYATFYMQAKLYLLKQSLSNEQSVLYESLNKQYQHYSPELKRFIEERFDFYSKDKLGLTQDWINFFASQRTSLNWVDYWNYVQSIQPLAIDCKEVFIRLSKLCNANQHKPKQGEYSLSNPMIDLFGFSLDNWQEHIHDSDYRHRWVAHVNGWLDRYRVFDNTDGLQSLKVTIVDYLYLSLSQWGDFELLLKGKQ